MHLLPDCRRKRYKLETSDNQFKSHSPTQLENHDYTLLRNILNLKWQVCIWHQGFLDLSSRPDRLHIGVQLNKCSETGSIHSGKNRPGVMFPFLSLKAVMKAVASHRKSSNVQWTCVAQLWNLQGFISGVEQSFYVAQTPPTSPKALEIKKKKTTKKQQWIQF